MHKRRGQHHSDPLGEPGGCCRQAVPVGAKPWIRVSQFARVVKGVDLRSTGGNSAWVRAPQLTLTRGASNEHCP